jgi:TolB-like protein/Flp pilus assembly protein TadD
VQLTKRYTENSDAYRAYLQGRFWWNMRSAEGFNRAIEYFQEAIDHDSNYALALSGMADTHILRGIYQLVAPSDAVREARMAAQAALRADESLAEAHVSLGGVQVFYDWDWASAQRSFKRAIELNPNYAAAYHWDAYVHLGKGDLYGALDTLERANQLDPLSLIIMTDLGRMYRLAGRYDESERVYLKAREIDADFIPIIRELAILYMETNRVVKTIEILEAAYEPAHWNAHLASALGSAYGLAGETAKARNFIRTFEQHASKHYVSQMVFAATYAGLGEYDRAIEYLKRAYLLHDPLVLRLVFFPSLEQLQTDPRVADLMRRGGFTPVRQPPVLKRLQPHKLMLAVLPFDNLSGDPEQEYFSDGMTDEMITTLGRLSPEKLGVIARTSAMRYKGKAMGIDEIGRELSVGYVVEGSIRRAADRVRITAKLIQVSDQTQLWSDSYERDLADVFKIQVEVAEAIADSLAVKLLPKRRAANAKPPTESSAAYDAYLLGRSYWAKRTPESLHTAIKHFKQAIELDPNYALAYCGLADTWSVLPYYVPGPYNEMNTEGKKAAEKALALDDTLAEVHVSIAQVLQDRGELEAANEHFQKAVAIDPNNATAHQWFGGALSIQGRYDQAAEEFEKAITLDPLSAVMQDEYGYGSVLARRFDKAIEHCNRALRLQPDFKVAYLVLTWAYIGKEDHNAAAKAFESYLRIIDRPAESITNFRRTYDASGLRAGFLEWLASLGNDFDSPGMGPVRRAPFYAWCNEKDRAFESLDRAIERGSPLLYHVATYFPYDNLRDDPRYADVLKRIDAKSRSEEAQSRP